MPVVLSWKPDMTSSDFFFCATVTLKPKKYFKRRRRETANLIRSLVMRWAMIWTLFNNSCCCVGVCSAGWSRWCLEFISLLTFFSRFIDRPALILPSLPRGSLSFFSLHLFPFLLKASLSLSLQHHFLSSSFSLPLALSLCHLPPVVDVSWCERWSHRERCSSTTLSLFKKPGCPGRGRRNGIECSSDARIANLSGVTDVDHKLLISAWKFHWKLVNK